jgi:hypothetical protein
VCVYYLGCPAAIRMRRIILSSVACPGVTYFSKLFKKPSNFQKKNVTEQKKRVLIFSTAAFWNINSKNNPERYYHKRAKVFIYGTRYSCQVLMKLGFSRQIFEKYSNCKKIPPVVAELFHEDGRTDRHDEASRFSQFCECVLKRISAIKHVTYKPTRHSLCWTQSPYHFGKWPQPLSAEQVNSDGNEEAVNSHFMHRFPQFLQGPRVNTFVSDKAA